MSALVRLAEASVRPVVRSDRTERNRLSKEAYKRAVELLTIASENITDRINSASEFSAQYLSQFKGEVERAMGQFQATYTQDFEGYRQSAEDLGSHFVKDVLAKSGIVMAEPFIPQTLIRTVAEFNADQIKGVSQGAIQAINRQLSVGALGGATKKETLRNIGKLLPSSKGAGSIAKRVDRIIRTEVNRMHSISSQHRMEQAANDGVNLGKYWLHQPGLLNPREDHIQTGRTYGPENPIGVKEFFRVGTEYALHPRDPRLSASQTIHCHCVHIPVVLPDGKKPRTTSAPRRR